MKSSPSGGVKEVNTEFDPVIVKAFARATFNLDFKAAYPQSTKEMRSAKWAEERIARIKNARFVMRLLKKQGITVGSNDELAKEQQSKDVQIA